MREYIASAMVRNKGTYTKPMPHPVWWRRLLGQTVSKEIKHWTFVHYRFKAYSHLVEEEWFQELIRASLMQHDEQLTGTGTLQAIDEPVGYIVTNASGGIVEQPNTNLLKNNK